jgi:hypothetical protein
LKKNLNLCNIFKPQNNTCKFLITEAEEQIKEKKMRGRKLEHKDKKINYGRRSKIVPEERKNRKIKKTQKRKA